ncbi:MULTISPECIES: hypothetical protein [unclassified Rothia (in: high G+C Gram-positive bacteria)]|uniref:hypothetical protein n=1 Tax=unclassified Rothia (in: high G+C Gram-positive bacteria) TaxID=2689056 RepID=UPI0019564447|nr:MULTISPECIES: hypothetical protein [unclassified Rothia (in: high G+C Gram-positive bacteria)]MBM7050828.1 hypothetical protein [Rothia sp. ZJ1223]QRZ61003.1 hypothetical protein JR346_06980 [Rothia sp. ZJ932]
MSKPAHHQQSDTELASFERQLEAVLALDPVERLSRLEQTAEDLRASMNSDTPVATGAEVTERE